MKDIVSLIFTTTLLFDVMEIGYSFDKTYRYQRQPLDREAPLGRIIPSIPISSPSISEYTTSPLPTYVSTENQTIRAINNYTINPSITLTELTTIPVEDRPSYSSLVPVEITTQFPSTTHPTLNITDDPTRVVLNRNQIFESIQQRDLSVTSYMIMSSGVFILAAALGLLKLLTRYNYSSKYTGDSDSKVLPIVSDTLRSFGPIQSKEGSFDSCPSDENTSYSSDKHSSCPSDEIINSSLLTEFNFCGKRIA